MSEPTLRQWLAEAPFSMGLSAGFFGFFAHSGVLEVLEEEQLLPRRVAGASAGALAGGLWASGTTAQALGAELYSLQRRDFWDPSPGLGLLRGRLFRQRLEQLLPVRCFEACRIPLAVSVYDLMARRTRVIEAGLLAPAIQASCTLPGLFHPTWHEGRPLLDGGILDRPGLHGIPRGERVFYHHLASRSPWRRKQSPALEIPSRPAFRALVIRGLPRVGPFRLHHGRDALEAARAATRRALDLPASHQVVEVTRT